MPEQLVQSSAERLFQYGVLGVLVVVFGFVIGYLYREWTKERKDLLSGFAEERKAYDTKIDGLHKEMITLATTHTVTVERLQQARNDDHKVYSDKLVDLNKGMTAGMVNVSASLDRTKETLAEVTETMREVGDDLRRRP